MERLSKDTADKGIAAKKETFLDMYEIPGQDKTTACHTEMIMS